MQQFAGADQRGDRPCSSIDPADDVVLKADDGESTD